MCDAMVHRGPDDEGVYVGRRRRARHAPPEHHRSRGRPAADLQRGSARVWVVFNGEIYNYRELRRDLERRGHVFRTASDTETIVHLYEDYGPRCVDRLRGMFAFAIWDARRRQLLLARDRLGIKPLYYAEQNGELLFASELKPILQLAARAADARLGGRRSPVHVPGDASGARASSTGSRSSSRRALAIASRTAARCDRSATGTCDVRARPRRPTEAELVEQLRELLDESVALHQVSDVPVGAFLSGGLDSSAVVATMAQPHRAAGQDVLDRLRRDRASTSWSHARQVATLFGTDHHDLVLEPDVVPHRRRPDVVSRRAVRRHVGHPDLHGVEAGGRAREGRADRRRRRRDLRRLRQVRGRGPRAGATTVMPAPAAHARPASSGRCCRTA